MDRPFCFAFSAEYNTAIDVGVIVIIVIIEYFNYTGHPASQGDIHERDGTISAIPVGTTLITTRIHQLKP